MRAAAGQFGRFLLVGGTATAVHYLILYGLHGVAGMSALLSSTVGFVVSAIFNFFASYRFTFRSRESMRSAALRYGASLGFGGFLNAAVFWALEGGLRWHYLAAQVVATGVVLVWNFVAGRKLIFRSQR